MEGFFDLVAARLRANCPALLQVATGMDAEAAVEMLALGPDVTALVHPLSVTAAPIREAAMVVSQLETWRFGVTAALVFPGGFAQFDPARTQILGTLRGWMAPGASMPVQYAGERVLQYAAGQDGGRWLHLFQFLVSKQASYGVQA